MVGRAPAETGVSVATTVTSWAMRLQLRSPWPDSSKVEDETLAHRRAVIVDPAGRVGAARLMRNCPSGATKPDWDTRCSTTSSVLPDLPLAAPLEEPPED